MFDLNEQRLQIWTRLLSEISPQSIKLINDLKTIERFWAFPGYEVLYKIEQLINSQQYHLAKDLIQNVITSLQRPRQKYYSPYKSFLEELHQLKNNNQHIDLINQKKKTTFEVLIMHPNPHDYYYLYSNKLRQLQQATDNFLYDVLFVTNLADAITALLTNFHIKSTIALSGCALESDSTIANQFLEKINNNLPIDHSEDPAILLAKLQKQLTPENGLFYLSEQDFTNLDPKYFSTFQQVFFHINPFKDLHYFITQNITQRYTTPFFNALQTYATRPKTVFHALPISQAASIRNSKWMQDFFTFYGEEVFNGETSSTQGGLDSLLNPQGAIKNAQDKASITFGSDHTFFITNGTSTANKIIMQANLSADDIVLISTDCHKSIPYGVIATGARVIFLQTTPVPQHDLYGAVELEQILETLKELKHKKQLHRVKQIILTNSTFDGLLYNVKEYMLKILAIKPDIIFHWDEAWFAHSYFHEIYRSHHAMRVARELQEYLRSSEYRERFKNHKDKDGLPNPDKVKIRVYAAQSTHKSLSCFRQGSMIHIIDEQFNDNLFLDAYYTHTTTSPNYQILASLDIARRQMAIEGQQLISSAIKLGIKLKEKINTTPALKRFFSVLTIHDFYPQSHSKYDNSNLEIINLLQQFTSTTFLIDPTKITLNISKTGLTGNQFKKLLINKYNIQVNKTSKHTVLFIINIGVTPQDIAHLTNALLEISDYLTTQSDKKTKNHNLSMPQKRIYDQRFTKDTISSAADIRKAYYTAYKVENTDKLPISLNTLEQAKQGKTWTAATFITPYPPGFPLLVPGQIIDKDIITYLLHILNDEIHGLTKNKEILILQG